jgi:hypothetical protein
MLSKFWVYTIQVHQVSWVAEHARLSLSLKRSVAYESSFRSRYSIVTFSGHFIDILSVLCA